MRRCWQLVWFNKVSTCTCIVFKPIYGIVLSETGVSVKMGGVLCAYVCCEARGGVCLFGCIMR